MIFPLEALVTVLLNGSIVRSYNPPLIRRGRVVAPVEPFLTSIAASIGDEDSVIVIVRGDRFAQVPAPPSTQPSQFARTYVTLAPILRLLGAAVHYDGHRHELDVRIAGNPVATPTPFNAAVPRAPSATVFTPQPSPTPRPIVSGKPAPRRTPLPMPEQTP